MATPASIETIVNYLARRLRNVDVTLAENNFPTASLLQLKQSSDTAMVDTGIFYQKGVYNFERNPYQYSMSSSDVSQLTYHMMTIDPDAVLKHGYRFETVCCKMDPIDYISDKVGVAINGTYFDMWNTYRPLGRYRQYWTLEDIYYESNIPLNTIYEPHYGWVILNDGKLDIQQSIDIGRVRDGFMAGPMLVNDGAIVFDEAKLNTTVNINGRIVKIFQCQLPSPLQSDFIPIGTTDTYTYNCDTLSPGVLAHASNPNPRTMLLITKSKQIVFVAVEGRTRTSPGADLVTLAQLAYQMGADKAINLDGGRSSNMAWRTPQSNEVYTTNRWSSYVVGNIVALHK
jgi:exopolysaccharide biosynthesis protein